MIEGVDLDYQCQNGKKTLHSKSLTPIDTISSFVMRKKSAKSSDQKALVPEATNVICSIQKRGKCVSFICIPTANTETTASSCTTEGSRANSKNPCGRFVSLTSREFVWKVLSVNSSIRKSVTIPSTQKISSASMPRVTSYSTSKKWKIWIFFLICPSSLDRREQRSRKRCSSFVTELVSSTTHNTISSTRQAKPFVT